MSETASSGARAPRAPRADARRNRDHILGVAERYFAQHGVTCSLDAIAKQAGVGAGTLYRHFPNREALLAELMTPRDAALVVQRDEISEHATTAADALGAWLDALTEWASAFDGLPEPLRAATATATSPLTVTCEGYITTTERFLVAAQREGSARDDVRARDLFLAALATSWVRGAAMADDVSGDALATLTRRGWESAPTPSPRP